MAAVSASHSLLSCGMAVLIARRRRTYVRHRELLTTAGCLHMQWAAITLALSHHNPLFDRHHSSPLALLGIMSLCSAVFYTAIYLLYGRLMLSTLRVVLPLLALPPLATARAMCGRMLEAPGVEAPLARLHDALALAQ